MAKTRKPDAQGRVTSHGKHGGNRAGESKREAEKPKRSSQAAGKDPHRGEESGERET